MKVMLIAFLGMCLGSIAKADVEAQGKIGLHGDIHTLEDCRAIAFLDERDSHFFRQACFAAVETLKVVQQAGGSQIQRTRIVKWKEQNNFQDLVMADLPGLTAADLNFVVEWGEQMLVNVAPGDSLGGSAVQGSVYVFYKPNPTLADSCHASDHDQYHGSNQFLFNYDPVANQWLIYRIKSHVVCRST